MLRSRYNSTSLGLTIAATADCNFRCVYCYEKNSIKTSKMTLENQNAIIEFVKKQIKVLSHLHISWYGGEPLLAFDIIEYLSPQLIQLCKENDVTYVASIVTNGYLLTPDKARALKKYKVGNIQVTLDGSEEIHDRRRPLAGGQGTFKQIISNLKDCVDFFDTVNIRINTDKTNVSSISQVKEILYKNGILKDNVGIYLGYVEDHNDAYELEKCLHIDQFCDVNLKFVRDNHFNIMMLYPKLTSNYCCADCNNAFIIDSEGYLYKCWNDVGVKERNVGHIVEKQEDDTSDFEKANVRHYLDFMMYDPTVDSKCVDCKCLPICMGGCPYKRVMEGDTEARCVTEKFKLEEYIKECAYELVRRRSETK